MAKIFYTAAEAVSKLGIDQDALKQAVRDGKLREFRDSGSVNYKVDDVDKMAASGELGGADKAKTPGSINLSDTDNTMPDLSAAGSIGLADTGATLGAESPSDATAIGGTGLGDSALTGSGINLSGTGVGDIVSLDDEEGDPVEGTSVGKSKEDTVVSSVGVSVFDEEELDESADPMAKTLLTDSAAGGTGLEGIGSGSGLLDLTRESDDTSLGAELLDEIYPGEESGTVEMGDATRAGLESAILEAEPTKTDEPFEPAEPTSAPAVTAPGPSTAAAATVSAGDAFAYGSSGLVAVALLVMCFGGLAIASMMRGVWPSLLNFIYGKLWMFGLGALVVAGAVLGLGAFLAKRSRAS